MLQDPNFTLSDYCDEACQDSVLVCCCASFEGQPVFGVVNEDLVHLVLRDASGQHLRHDVIQDVRVSVAAVLGEAVLGVDVMGDHDLVLVALLDEKSQAAARWRGGNLAALTSSGMERTVIVNLQPIFMSALYFVARAQELHASSSIHHACC